ncbi:NUDIX hydrolase [Marinoscillum sp. MHG1-6]|uniref:NUDIX domain-containing protein n=1 Tax=Marinoscillum sp. MHG1-6 TaxID=2959627 RepID=UPI002157A68C|nr:NUDIX hydrolase [Marinoscillum sp. MHG1-6]
MVQDINPFSGSVRVRVCGLLEEKDKILLLKHEGLGSAGYLWSPPGGGVEFGQSIKETLKREFLEETNLSIDIEHFMFVNEYIDSQYHAIELFFKVKKINGQLKLGKDPELAPNKQILSDAQFISIMDLQKMDHTTIHNSLLDCTSSGKLFQKNGFFASENK